MGIITISRQTGAGDTTIASAVAERLWWDCVDHARLDQEVAESGIALAAGAEQVDDATHAPLPHDSEEYVAALRDVMAAHCRKGNVVIAGRGATFIVKEPNVLHVRLVADKPFRIRRMMEVRWLDEAAAQDLVASIDSERAAFVRKHFGADVDDPAHYDAVLNTAELGVPGVVDRIVSLAHDRFGTGAGAA